MDIIDALERGEPRGPYSGGLGFFSVSGAFDVNVVIRTCVVRPFTDEAWIGAGGAITALSDAADEWDEMKLKASAIVRACEATMKSAFEEESDDDREEGDS
jgi:para-aminobenzoate synthetase